MQPSRGGGRGLRTLRCQRGRCRAVLHEACPVPVAPRGARAAQCSQAGWGGVLCLCPPRSRERAAAWSVPPVEGAGGGHHWSLPPWGWVPVEPMGLSNPYPAKEGAPGAAPPRNRAPHGAMHPCSTVGVPAPHSPPPPCAATGLRGAALPLPLAVPGGARGAGWGPPGRVAGAGSAGAAAGLRPRGVRCFRGDIWCFRGDIYSQRQRQRLQRGSCSL